MLSLDGELLSNIYRTESFPSDFASILLRTR